MLELRGITKRFPGVTANDAVSLHINAGEVLALLGENGAGKSTLISIMYGLYRPDEGELLLNGQRVSVTSPAHALRLGIGLVPQHPMLVSRHTVAENLALGAGSVLFPARGIRGRIAELSGRYGLAVNPDARISTLAPGEKQRVEILRSLLRGAGVLILDEPTSVLTPQEAEGLFRVMRELRNDGKSLVFISHKLEEVLSVCDRVTVLRRGKVVGHADTINSTKESLAELMVGKSVNFERKRGDAVIEGAPLLTVTGLSAQNSRGLPALKDVNFTLRRGEVIGVAGVAGNGQSELIEVLSGLLAPSAGTMVLDGKALAGTPAELFSRGVAHIPEDRIHMGTVPSMTVSENMALREYQQPPYSSGLMRNLKAQDERAEREVKAYQIATPSIHTTSRLLSGGNIQKVILARELAGNPQLILAVHPTYGLDIGATDQVHTVLLQKTESGAGVLIVSEDLEELMSLSDRIAVLYHGELLGPYPVQDVTRERLGLLMTGGSGAAHGTGGGDLSEARPTPAGLPGGLA
ncbi:ABC transporter ATP-binding protein [Deinococcus sp. KNUC1210]|uniref:ABC transporter ATP-binding protein n=1 Tax=Deinococcus sp. KNUC1210 TaxID=2917691 RepID=UPI001EF0FB49|nr:ABC transporter ATP-binding protein [Deinococcus sp. KNUC1210]ULH14865.1 ABC transporter ATP-binding protein [Deinococcus sp. KNUC1210]